MILATCIGVLRDENRCIVGYRLADRHNHVVVIKPIILKDKIANKEIDVSNLTLTSDNRLVVSNKDNTDNYASFIKDLKSVHKQAITNIGSGELNWKWRLKSDYLLTADADELARLCRKYGR